MRDKNRKGIYKTVDELGRMVLPKELREHLDVKAQERVELIVEEDCVVLRKHREICTFCRQGAEGMILFMEKPVCPACLRALSALAPASEAGSEA